MSEEEGEKRFEVMAGLTLAVFAAALAVVDLGAGKYGDDEIIGTNERANLYSWYQSKGTKQNLVEQEQNLLQALVDGGTISGDAIPKVKERIAKLTKKVEKYEAEKKEILEGSEAVGPEGQVLDVDGKKGTIIGTKPLEARLETLGAAGDVFDLATLWLQLSMVLGAIALVLQDPRLKKVFFAATVILGIVGSIYGVQAYQIAG